MKTKMYLCIAYFSVISFFVQTANAQANTELSNLASPTKVNQSVIPITTNSKDLGTISMSWRNTYLAGSIYLDGKRFLTNGNDANNMFVGTDAGNKRSTSHTGRYNTATGHHALYSFTTGISNTAFGSDALYSNTSGTANTANGTGALRSNTTARHNTATGFTALYYNTFGIENTADGSGALSSNTTGNFNTAAGHLALYTNIIGEGNTAIGHRTLYYNTSGEGNTAVGKYALYKNNSGDYNTAIGYQALYRNTTGFDNTAIGYFAGYSGEKSLYCTFVGYDADQNSIFATYNNSTALGRSSRITASNQVRIGNSIITSIGGYEPWTNLSDGRFKKNVNENVPGLAFINQLHAITYTMDVTSLRSFLGEDRQNETDTADSKMVRERDPEAEGLIQKGIEEKEKIIRTGFVAQEVEEAAKKIGYDFSGVDKPQNEHTPYGLRYSEFVVPLVKAVQELSAKNDELQKQNDTQKKINDNLQKQMIELKAMIQAGRFSADISSASLEQNIPNPFNHTTTIGYTLPEKFSSAQIIIRDINGKQLKQTTIRSGGKGTININTSALAAGVYHYSLYVDGRLIETKQMQHL